MDKIQRQLNPVNFLTVYYHVSFFNFTLPSLPQFSNSPSNSDYNVLFLSSGCMSTLAASALNTYITVSMKINCPDVRDFKFSQQY